MNGLRKWQKLRAITDHFGLHPGEKPRRLFYRTAGPSVPSLRRECIDLQPFFVRPGQQFLNKQTPDHGRLPAGPFFSGKRPSNRRKNGGRLNRVAVFSNPFTSIGSQPCAVKKAGPSAGANLKGAPTLLTCFPVVLCIILSSLGEARP